MIVNIGRRLKNIDEAVAVITDRTVFRKLDLTEHDDGTYDQRNGNRELQYHQDLPWNRSEPSGAKRSLQYVRQLEPGQIQSRIAACNQAGKDAKSNSKNPK